MRNRKCPFFLCFFRRLFHFCDNSLNEQLNFRRTSEIKIKFVHEIINKKKIVKIEDESHY